MPTISLPTPMLFFLFFFVFILLIHPIYCLRTSSSLSLLPTRTSDPGSHSRLFFPLPATVYILTIRRDLANASSAREEQTTCFKISPADDAKCDGVTYWAIYRGKIWIYYPQPKVIFITWWYSFNEKIRPLAVTSTMSSTRIFERCVWYTDRAHYGLLSYLFAWHTVQHF